MWHIYKLERIVSSKAEAVWKLFERGIYYERLLAPGYQPVSVTSHGLGSYCHVVHRSNEPLCTTLYRFHFTQQENGSYTKDLIWLGATILESLNLLLLNGSIILIRQAFEG
jgi:hypothetical protein